MAVTPYRTHGGQIMIRAQTLSAKNARPRCPRKPSLRNAYRALAGLFLFKYMKEKHSNQPRSKSVTKTSAAAVLLSRELRDNNNARYPPILANTGRGIANVRSLLQWVNLGSPAAISLLPEEPTTAVPPGALGFASRNADHRGAGGREFSWHAVFNTA